MYKSNTVNSVQILHRVMTKTILVWEIENVTIHSVHTIAVLPYRRPNYMLYNQDATNNCAALLLCSFSIECKYLPCQMIPF